MECGVLSDILLAAPNTVTVRRKRLSSVVSGVTVMRVPYLGSLVATKSLFHGPQRGWDTPLSPARKADMGNVGV